MPGFASAFFELLAPTPCLGCDEPLAADDAELCAACAPGAIHWQGCSAAFEYGGPVAEAIHRYKYEGRSELAPRLAAMMLTELGPAPSVDAVLPVPLHWRRRLARGYDQAALLGVELARGLRLPFRPHWLRRIRHTSSQVGLSEAEREANVDGAFRAVLRAKPIRVLLVDDVRTTGATLRAASDALTDAGFASVRAYTFAARL
jgi:ComF family protein